MMMTATSEHIQAVRENMQIVKEELSYRALMHDHSKLEEPEKTAFENAVRLSELEYGSPEYHAAKDALGPALHHHYAHNSHHPEHYENGIAGMSLLDIIEMLCDWHAATQRMKDGGNMMRSLEINKERFQIDDQLYAILVNTAKELDFI